MSRTLDGEFQIDARRRGRFAPDVAAPPLFPAPTPAPPLEEPQPTPHRPRDPLLRWRVPMIALGCLTIIVGGIWPAGITWDPTLGQPKITHLPPEQERDVTAGLSAVYAQQPEPPTVIADMPAPAPMAPEPPVPAPAVVESPAPEPEPTPVLAAVLLPVVLEPLAVVVPPFAVPLPRSIHRQRALQQPAAKLPSIPAPFHNPFL